jgi:hypothetical protein
MSVRLILPLVVFCVLASGCASNQKSSTSSQSSVFPVLSQRQSVSWEVGPIDEPGAFRRFDSHAVGEGAAITFMNYVDSFQGKPVESGEITADSWAPAIRNLEPEYVYAHGVNIAVVRTVQSGKEHGIYIGLSIASTPGPNDEEFTRMLIAHAPCAVVFTFIRDGCLDRGLGPL